MRPLAPIRLVGDAAQRGAAHAQAAMGMAAAIRATIEQRAAAAGDVLSSPDALRFLAAQTAFARSHCGPEMAEFDAIAAGLALDPALPFALMHLSALAGRYEVDGCTAWARPVPGGGAVLSKNRDLSGGHRNFQQVFLHVDAAAPGGAVLAVGTLGAPGVYSSGMNAAGLALADTAIEAPRHQVGWLRYFLMTRVAFSCATVEEACELIARQRHAGGGSLILADASGAVATVELRAEGAVIDRQAPAFRTNHFLSEPLADVRARQSEAAFRSTTGRFAALARRLSDGLGTGAEVAVRDAMSSHAASGHAGGENEGLCRHGVGDRSHTVSCTVYRTRNRTVEFAEGYPCEAEWRAFSLGGAA